MVTPNSCCICACAHLRPAGQAGVRRFSSRTFLPFLVLFILGALHCDATAAPAAPKEAKAPKRLGYAVHLTLPINGQTFERTETFVRRAIEKAEEQRARLVLVFEFTVPDEQETFASKSEFGAALSLAEFLTSADLNGVRTVAWIPQPIEGHAVLVALACDEIIMAKGASLGKAGSADKVITEARRTNYREIANRRKTIPAPVAMWLLDETQEVLVAETEVSTEYIAPSKLDALKKEHALKSPPRKLYDRERPGESLAAVAGKLSGEEARQMGFVSYLAETHKEVAKALDLPADSLDYEDPSLLGNWNAIRVDVKGPINADTAAKIKLMIDRRVQQDGVNFICLWVDSPGGSLEESLSLANYLAGFEQAKVRTVAYIPSEARSDAALVALACQQVAMAPRAVIGGSGAREFAPDDIRRAVVSISDREGGPWRNRAWSPVAAMIDPNLAVYRCTQEGETAYFSERELEDLQRGRPDDAPKWKKHEAITLGGQPLELSGQRAKELGLIFATADGFADFKKLYHLENDPSLLEPGWAAVLIDALAHPGAAALLLMIGFVALYIELHTPGIGVGGFVATVCFVMFFWSRFLGGTAGWLEASLFIAGLCCLLLEIFVLPGFGVFGLGGGVLVLASLILASQTFVLPHNSYQFAQLQRSMLTIAGAGGGFIVAAFMLRKWLPKTPVFSHVFLPPPQGEEAESISRREAVAHYDDLLGQHGVTTTQLSPSGKVRFGDRLVDVVSDGDLVARGSEVEVIEVKGSRVVVRTLNQ